MHHSYHETSGKGMPVHQRDRRHRICEQTVPELVQYIRHVRASEDGVAEIQAIGVELGNGGCSNHYAGRVAVFDNVQG